MSSCCGVCGGQDPKDVKQQDAESHADTQQPITQSEQESKS